MSRKRKTKRPVSNYLKSAIENNSIVPSLKKYRRRKRLSRWEKGAITRAENKIRRHGGKTKLFPLSKRQQKSLKDKSAIVGKGIKAVSLNNTADDAEIRIVKGELRVRI